MAMLSSEVGATLVPFGTRV